MVERSHTRPVLNIRVSHAGRAILEAAELEVLNRSIVGIPTKDWGAFETWLNRPAQTNPGLEKLARRTPFWER